MRNRYLARSRPGSSPHERLNALRATATALLTSSTPARATSASGSSVAGSMVVNHWPLLGATSLPPTNRPVARPAA